MDYYIIDRFEGQWAVCEAPGGTMERIDRSGLPAEAAEGDLLVLREGGWRVDREATEARRSAMKIKRARLRKITE